jgi:lysophospholipase L1-like esterase
LKARLATRSRLVRRGVAAALGVALAFASLELLLRALGLGPEVAVELRPAYEKFDRDEELIWTLKKSWRGRELNGAPVTTGSLGLRGSEPSPDAEATLLVLGDSVVYGHHLGDAQTLPVRLESELRARTGTGLVVVNGGIPGYSTFQEARLYRRLAPAIEPDLVLLGFCLNDVTERYVTLADYGGPRFFMRNVDTWRDVGALRRLWLSSAVRSAFAISARGLASRLETYNVGSLWRRPDAPEIRAAWQLVFGELDELAAAVQADGARLALVAFPYRLQLRDARAALPQQTLAQFAAARGIELLDLLPLLQAQPDARRLFLDANHLSAAGTLRVAEWIAAFVAERELLAAPRP